MRVLGMLAFSSLLLGGCALSQSTDKIVLDYNRDFAKARNEVLLLNVLRAAAREPLQFSTMGTISGQIGNSSGLSIPFTNLIAGGKNIISPSLSLNDAVNPTVSITPLAGKEFAAGILKPIGTDTIQLFLHNGWDPEFLLPLVVGGVVCPDRRLLLNSGEYLEWVEEKKEWRPTASFLAFKEFFYRSAPNFSIGPPTPNPDARAYFLTDKETLDAIKSGFGSAHSLVSIDQAPNEKKKLLLQRGETASVQGFKVEELCKKVPEVAVREGREPLKLSPQAVAALSGAYETGDKGRIIFRSVGSIIHYLGESHRVRYRRGAADSHGLTYLNRTFTEQTLFKIDWGLRDDHRVVQTRFQETIFYVPRLDLRNGEGNDRTLKTLSFLDQLIALHTSESSIRGAQPVITVN